MKKNPSKTNGITLKTVLIAVAAVAIIGLGYVAYQNPELFKADISSPTGVQDTGLRIVQADYEGCFTLSDINDSIWKTFYVKYYDPSQPGFPTFNSGIYIHRSVDGGNFGYVTSAKIKGPCDDIPCYAGSCDDMPCMQNIDGEEVYQFDYLLNNYDIGELRIKVTGDTMESSELTLQVHLSLGDSDSDGIDDACDLETCGNDNVEGSEECDGALLNNQTCADVDSSKPEGTLACSSDCTFDSSGCIQDSANQSASLADEAFDLLTNIITDYQFVTTPEEDNLISTTYDANGDGKFSISDIAYMYYSNN